MKSGKKTAGTIHGAQLAKKCLRSNPFTWAIASRKAGRVCLRKKKKIENSVKKVWNTFEKFWPSKFSNISAHSCAFAAQLGRAQRLMGTRTLLLSLSKPSWVHLMGKLLQLLQHDSWNKDTRSIKGTGSSSTLWLSSLATSNFVITN